MATGTVVISEAMSDVSAHIVKVVFAWSEDQGAAGDTTTNLFNGTALNLITEPSAVDVPADLYDVEVLDDDGYDIFVGAGLNRSNTAIEQTAGFVAGGVPRNLKNTHLTLSVTNASGAKPPSAGIAIVYIAE